MWRTPIVEYADLESSETDCEAQHVAVDPPFTNLDSFSLCTTVLAYLVYQEDVRPLLVSLSRNSAFYYLTHEPFLRILLKPYPKLSSTLQFGFKFFDFDRCFPTLEQFRQLRLEDENAKLCQIKYKCFKDNQFLSAIQLVMTNGVASPMFEKEALED